MGYNIEEISGTATGGVDVWGHSLDLSDPAATSVSGDFAVVPFGGGTPTEATGGGGNPPYTFSTLSTTAYGSLAFNTSTGQYTFTVDRAAVVASGTDQVVSFTIIGRSGGSSDDDTVNITILICVARGTLIETIDGSRPVETLRIGDRVTTYDGPAKPVRWIGSRRLTGADLAKSPNLRPIRIRKGALGRSEPNRDLLVSPNHRILLRDERAELFFGETEVLAPAKALVNDQTIVKETDTSEIEYFHLLFDEHEVIYTDGLLTESFHPGQYSIGALDNEVREELLRLFPQLQRSDGYGETARIALRPWEASILAARSTGEAVQGGGPSR